jgi:hypothetical protein
MALLVGAGGGYAAIMSFATIGPAGSTTDDAGRAVLRDQARGLLLVLVGLGAAIISGPFVVVLLGGPIAYRSPAALLTQPTCFARAPASLQFLVNGVFTALVGYGLLVLTRREDARHRRGVRVASWLLIIPLVVHLLPAWLLPPLPKLAAGDSGPTTAPLSDLLSAHLALGSIADGVGTVAYAVVALIVLRFLHQRLKGIPRPGLARFARIEFWGLLISATIATLGCACLAATDWSTTMPILPGAVAAMLGGSGLLGFGSAGIVLLAMTCTAFFRGGPQAFRSF